ncbi:MAG: MotA/TolQ/ExbB proton channel family protein [Deltaproteobacteria bacterium]|nr:MotA/TolQ/ExbB proton channel family protein [Deltaproteobacteria bacterium]
MDILNLMQSALYLIMNALLYPVMGLLLYLVVAVLFISGNFTAEFVSRRRVHADVDKDCEHLAAQVAGALRCDEAAVAAGYIRDYLGGGLTRGRQLRDFLQAFAGQVAKGREYLDIRAEKILQQQEMRVAVILDKTRVMIRIGPMLGLMGTLIPMGPALLALTQGDLTLMANSLIIAFGTTVAGLAVGVVAYLLAVVRDRWYARDLRDMEYLVDLVNGQLEHACAPVEDERQAAVLAMAGGAQ